MNTFTFNGTVSSTYGLYISEKNAYSAPEKDVSEVKIPGRSGNLLLDDNRFENIKIKYDCYFIPVSGYTTLFALSKAIKAWLSASAFNYYTLTDTYNPGYFRKAAYSSQIDISEVVSSLGKIQITFNCKPFLYSDAGLNLITMTPDGEYQQEEITFTGAYSKTGGVHFTVTAACMAPTTTRSMYFELNNSYQTAAQVAEIIKYNIDENAGTANNIRDFFTITRDGAKLTFTAKTMSANDLTMNFSFTNDAGANYTGYNDILTSTTKTIGKLPNSGTVVNPELFPSYPYIKVTGTGNVTLSIGSASFVLTAMGPNLEIDSELMNVYRGATSYNSKMTSSGFPILAPGNNAVSWTGTVTKVEIIPRWCTL